MYHFLQQSLIFQTIFRNSKVDAITTNGSRNILLSSLFTMKNFILVYCLKYVKRSTNWQSKNNTKMVQNLCCLRVLQEKQFRLSQFTITFPLTTVLKVIQNNFLSTFPTTKKKIQFSINLNFFPNKCKSISQLKLFFEFFEFFFLCFYSVSNVT